MANKYSEAQMLKFEQALDSGRSARQAGSLIGMNPTTAASYATKYRRRKREQAVPKSKMKQETLDSILIEENEASISALVRQNNALIKQNQVIIKLITELNSHLVSYLALEQKPKEKPKTERVISQNGNQLTPDLIDLLPAIIDCELSGYTEAEILLEFEADELDRVSLQTIRESEDYKTTLHLIQSN